jgi:release factor glutamine methyltransferase
MPEWDGLFYSAHGDVYLPSDDTFMLARAVQEAVRPGERFLEVGCGTALVALAASRAGARAWACDVNPHAVRLAVQNAQTNRLGLRVVRTDLLAGLAGPFDVVAFNPPYLPTAEEDHVEGWLDRAFDGGPDGNRVALRFCAALAQLQRLPRLVLIVHSSLADATPLVTAMQALGYRHEVAAEEHHFHERIYVRAFLR